ncbi:MAG: hypothetical protein EBX78_01660 [Gammaproteobacteria bacterium]|nr:hypothetical protein [Gammaproteobacteria bacterium]
MWRDSWREWRNRLLMSPRFQRAAAAFWLSRPQARREARELFDLVAGFTYSQITLSCVRLGLLERVRAGRVSEAILIESLAMSVAAARTLLRAAAALELLEPANLDEDRAGWALGRRGAALLGNPGVLAMIEHHAVLYGDLVDPLAMLRAPRGATALAKYWPYASASTPGEVAAEKTHDYTRLMAASQSLVAEEILDAYDVRGHRAILDVGGGDGSFLRALAQRSANIHLMLFDLPGVAGGRPATAGGDETLAGAGIDPADQYLGGHRIFGGGRKVERVRPLGYEFGTLSKQRQTFAQAQPLLLG